MEILAVDPGNLSSAYVRYDADTGDIGGFGKIENDSLLTLVGGMGADNRLHGRNVLVCEMIAAYGMPVGREVFETCVWIGRMIEAWGGDRYSLLYRREVKLHLCGNPRAKDPNIRQALLDKFGPQGTKKSPGRTYGVKADIWAALAVAVTFAETGRKILRLGTPG